MDAELLKTLPLWFVAFLLSLVCHEAAHALAGKLGGDNTAEEQVTLNPIPHVKREPFGTILVPILTFFMNGMMLGWASAPYSPLWAARFPRRAALMALAGPVANFVLVLLAVAAVHIGITSGFFSVPPSLAFDNLVLDASGKTNPLTMFVSVVFSLNLLLGCFNLLPVPPLDGHGVVPLFLSDELGEKWRSLFRQKGAGMMGLMVAWVVFGKLFSAGTILSAADFLMYPGMAYH